MTWVCATLGLLGVWGAMFTVTRFVYQFLAKRHALGVPFLNVFLIWRLVVEARLYLKNRGVQSRWLRNEGI